MAAKLSPRELQIARLVCCGLSNKEIGGLCSISEQTVKNHITAIGRKWGVHGKNQIIICGFHWGILTPGEGYKLMRAVTIEEA